MGGGEEIGVQAALWSVGSGEPYAAAFRSVASERARCKPYGGMWTSTHLGPDELSGWAQWCRDERWGDNDADLWLLTPEPDASVYIVDSYDDLKFLHQCYGRTEDRGSYQSHYIDWTLVAERYAAVSLTDEGQWRTRLTMPYDLYGWDCESTLWLRWAFVKVEHAGVVTVNASALDQAVSAEPGGR